LRFFRRELKIANSQGDELLADGEPRERQPRRQRSRGNDEMRLLRQANCERIKDLIDRV
jgi:hypothetical protein